MKSYFWGSYSTFTSINFSLTLEKLLDLFVLNYKTGMLTVVSTSWGFCNFYIKYVN